jgi:hypothetical protein
MKIKALDVKDKNGYLEEIVDKSIYFVYKHGFKNIGDLYD